MQIEKFTYPLEQITTFRGKRYIEINGVFMSIEPTEVTDWDMKQLFNLNSKFNVINQELGLSLTT